MVVVHKLEHLPYYQIGKKLRHSKTSLLENVDLKSEEDLTKAISASSEEGKGEWLDLCGLITSHDMTDDLLDNIESGQIGSIQ